jgi:type II secretory pathway component PulF
MLKFIVIGGVVLFIVMAVLSPIYNLTSQIGN